MCSWDYSVPQLRLVLLPSQTGTIFANVFSFVCLSVYQLTGLRGKISSNFHEKILSVMKPCRITNYCYGKNEFKSGVDISQNG